MLLSIGYKATGVYPRRQSLKEGSSNHVNVMIPQAVVAAVMSRSGGKMESTVHQRTGNGPNSVLRSRTMPLATRLLIDARLGPRMQLTIRGQIQSSKRVMESRLGLPDAAELACRDTIRSLKMHKVLGTSSDVLGLDERFLSPKTHAVSRLISRGPHDILEGV